MRHRLARCSFSLWFVFTCCVLGSESGNGATRALQQKTTLTLVQIEELIKAPTPDSTISVEIERQGISFQVDDDLIRRLRELGAGPLTIGALQKQRNSNGQGRLIVLVADFRGVNNENVGMSQILIQKLREALAPYPDVEVQPLGKAITSEQGRDVAVREGREHNAAIVLWGWFVESPVQGLVNAHIENLRPFNNFSLPSGREEYRVPLQEFNEFAIQSRLSNDFTTITLAAAAVARFDSADYKGAIALLSEAIRIGVSEPNLIGAIDLYTLRATANLYLANGNGDHPEASKQAIADSEQAMKINGEVLSPYLVRAYAYLVLKSSEQALAESKRLLAKFHDPSDRVPIYVLLLRALDQENDRESDVNADQIRSYSKELLATTEKLNSPSATSYLQRADAFDRLGNKKEAWSSLTKALELKPKGLTAARIHFLRGTVLRDRGDYVSALREFREAISIDAKATYVYVQIGHVLYWQKDYVNAIASYQAAIKLDSEDGTQYSNLGRVFQDSGDLKSALTNYNRAIELTQTNDEIYFNRATLLYSQKRIDEALLDLNKCLDLTPSYRAALDWRADIHFGRAAYDASIEDYNRIIEIDRADAHAFLYRGISKSKKGDSEGALDDYNQSIVLSADYAEAYLQRGMLYANRNMRKQAVEDLTQAFRNADNSETRQQAQQQLMKLGAKLPIQKR